MAKKALRKPAKARSPLTTSPTKRSTVKKLSGATQGDFPAGLSQPALRALAGAGYKNLAQLTQARQADLARLHGMGPKGIRVLREELAKQGKSFLG